MVLALRFAGSSQPINQLTNIYTLGHLDFHEVNMMMEKLGQTKTRLELNDIIAEVDREKKGFISLSDFFTVCICMYVCM